jgi:hypothetical protein
MSNLNYAAINESFPIAGQDNDSEGFRGNFAAIKASLSEAQADLTDLQLKSVLKQTLDDTDTVANDLLGSTIKNGLYSNFNGLVPDAGETTFTGNQHTIHFSGVSENSGALQVFKISQNSLITFANWRNTPVQFTSMRIHLLSNGLSAWTVQFSNSGGSVVFDQSNGIVNQTVTLTGYTPGVTDPVHTVVDVWTYDGDTVFMRVIGNYTTLGELITSFGNVTIGGTLNATGTTESTSSSTGAVKLSGGVGIAKSANIGLNLNVAGTTESTSKTTGAVIIAGGVGVNKRLNVGGNVVLGSTVTNEVVIRGNLTVEGNTSLSTTSITIANINDISNVDTATALTANQILKYDGTEWKNSNNNLNDVTDVNIVLPASGDALRYDAGTSTWTNNYDLVEYAVTIDDNGSGTQEVFFLDGVALRTDSGAEFDIELVPGKKYRFNLSNASNAQAPLRFSTTPDTSVPSSITPYTTGVTIQGTAGTVGAYIELRVSSDTPKILFLYGLEGGGMLDTSLLGAAYPVSVGGFYFTGSENLVSGAAASLAKTASYFTATTTPATATLMEGKDGQTKAFMYTAGDSTMTISVVNPGWGGAGTILLDTIGQGCLLQYINNKWFCVGNNGAVFA